MVATATGNQLYHCPKNVKEALEWLEALGSGATACAQVIQSKILVNTTGHTLGSVCQELCQKAAAFMTEIRNGGHTYPSTYQTGGWSQLCQPQGSTRCCATSGRGACTQCNTSTGQQCHGCCKNCPQQICARIFCLIVPVVYSALWYLVQYANGYSSGNGNTEAYLGALGFNNGAGGLSLTAEQVKQALQQQRQQSSGTLASLVNELHSATLQIKNALQNTNNIFVDGQSAVTRSGSHSTTLLTTPTSAKDLMLWTIFLPYCCNYQNVHHILSQSLSAQNGGTTPGVLGPGLPHSSPLEDLMYGLHLLFIGMEAGGQGSSPSSSSPPSSHPPQPPRTLFDGINMVSQGVAPYEYYTNGSGVGSTINGTGPDQCLKLLIAGIPIISWAVEMLQGQYGGGRAQGSGYYNANNLEHDLGFGGGTGMQQLSSTLGQQIIHYIHLALEPIKTAYSSDRFYVNSSSHSGTYPSTTPTTFREMLLWLQGLPCSQAYSAVRELLTNGSSRSSSTPSNGLTTTDPLVEIIFNLPYLFYHLEGMNTSTQENRVSQSNGTMTRYITELFQRQGIKVNGNKGSSKAPTPTITYTASYGSADIKKTFCAIVTVVYYVVDHLQRKYNGSGGSSNLYDIGNSSGLLEFLGWNRAQSNGVSAFGYGSTNLKRVLELCFGNGSGTAQGRGTNGDPLKELFQQLRGTLSATSALSTSSSAPTTFRDTLLWLVGAPLTGEYESAKGEWTTAVPSRPPSHPANTLQDHIIDTIVGVLQLFNKLEGDILSAVLGVFQNGTSVSLKYNYGGTSGSTTDDQLGHSIFGVSVVMRSVFGFLQQRCNGMGALGAGTEGASSANYSWQSCSVTCANGGGQAGPTAECQPANPLCKFLCLLGWDHQTRGAGATAASSTPLTGTAFHTDLVSWFGDLASQDQGALSSYTYVTSSGNEPVLEKLYQCAVQWFQKKTGSGANKGTDSSGTTATTPTTIREMMLWLIGLPLHSVYTELTKNGSSGTNGVIENKFESLKSSTDRTNNMYNISTQLTSSSQITNAILSSSQGMIITMLAIEGSIKSVWDFLTKGLKKEDGAFNYGSGSESKDSKSGSKDSTSGNDADGEGCLELLVDYTYKVHYQLRFLLVMCSTPKDNGGWKECEYSGNGSVSCNCQLKTSCLKKFLEDNSTAIKTSTEQNGNKFVGHAENGNLTMGFSTITLSTTPSTTNKLTGADIHALLKYFVDTVTEYRSTALTHSPKPFSLLAQCIVAIGQRAPSTLGDCFELVRQLGNGELYNYVDRELKKELKDITWEVTGEQKNGVTALITAIQNIISTTHNSHTNDKSLMSLMCTGNSSDTSGTSCAPYMKSLSSGLYSFYLPEITDSSVNFPFLQYLYDRLRQLLDKMKELKEAFEKCECCKTGSSGKSCEGLIQCQYAHPILYKFGFVFGSPQGLKSVTKKCTDIKKQLEAVLSCTQGSESALFSAFECVIQVTYSILLKSAKEKVEEEKNKWNGKVNSTEETKKAFENYVHNAMYNSYPKLICTFACKVFDSGHDCSNSDCKKRFTAPGPAPTTIIADLSTSTTLQVTKSAVTSITAVIPQYTAPVIDRYHYRAFQKGTTSDGKSSTSYTFKDAIDFHVSGANCITPAPVALRSVIDWILRITVGDTNTNSSNENITKLSGEVKTVLKECGMTVTGDAEAVQKNVTALVEGLRKFVGYEDKSQSVKEGVKVKLGDDKNNNGIRKALKDKIDKINEFIGDKGKENFGKELGKALLKGRYAGTFKQKRDGLADTIISTLAFVTETITGIQEPLEQKTFKDVVGIFTKILSSTHEGCKELKCKSINSSATASQGDDQKGGLEILKELFTELQKFAQKWNSIGQDNGHGILQKQKNAAMNAKWTFNGSSGSSSSNGQYFTKLHQALKQLGACANKVQELSNNGSGYNNSQQYRDKITALITGLKDEVLSKLRDEKDTSPNNEADPQYAVNGAQRLIEETKRGVERKIVTSIETEIVNSYSSLVNRVNISYLINCTEGNVKHYLDLYKSHLDDLKQLCQWLYRMGKLYASGLKGFVESLVRHLEHIVQVINYIYDIKDGMNQLKDMGNIFSDLYIDSVNSVVDMIAKLLSSYILKDADKSLKITGDKASTYRTFLRDLRLLALDRYTLQVWQDESCPKNRVSSIRHWSIFRDGIVRHSDLEGIKRALGCLTLMEDYRDIRDLKGVFSFSDCSSSSSAASSTPPSRIHDFHAICVIQKFSFEAPIAELERSLKELRGIQRQLGEVKGKCNANGGNLSSDTVVTSFCDSVSQFLSEPYGIYSFAKFVHTIMGPNIFSAVIVAMEELKDKEKYKNGDGNLDKIKGILGVMTEGLDGENKEHYTLTKICEKLQTFITTLRKEYIFAYPVVTATATQAIVPAPQTPPAKIPKCENDDHSMSSICKHCHPYLARIFIGAIPNLYRHCRLLYEMCTWKTDSDPVTASWHNDPLRYKHNGVHDLDYRILSFAGYVKAQGWTPRIDNGPDGAFYDTAVSFTGNKLFEALKVLVSLKDALTNTPDDPNSLKPLDQLFKAVMQHFKEERKKKRQQREQKLRQAFNKDPNNKGIPFQAPPAPLPSTVRQVLFWLHEMDTNKAFYDAMLLHINTLCQRSSINISHDTILHVLKLSITQCLEVLATIEDPGRQNAQYYYELYTEEHYYAYPTVNIPLFFYTFVEKLMAAFLELNFVCVQCEFRATEGGWSECHIGKSEHSMKGQMCRCTKPHTKASPLIPVTVSGSVVCPRPLSAFLFSDQKNQLRIPSDGSQCSAYMSKGTMPCGFKLTNKIEDAKLIAPTTSMTGNILVEPLRKLVGGHVTGRHGSTTTNGLNTLSTVIYLRDLLRYVLCLAVRPPWSMSENMAFFYRVTESWKKDKGGVPVALRNNELLQSIHAEIALFPGSFDGKKLTTAVERFAGVEDSEHQNSAASPSGHHQYDLRTLMGCKENSATSSGATAQCSPFMFPLALDVYTHYDHKNSRAYLSWILNFAFGIYGQLRGLQEIIQDSACVRNTSQSPSDCPSLPMCPGVLSALYQSGSSFMDQGQLAMKDNAQQSGTNTTKKTCTQFRDVLSGLFNCNTASCTPLHNLIVQCEAFLWSIRMPFSLVQLSLWSFAVFFISYVFVVPLDHFKIKSHLFNRLKYTMHPSLLIADQQRRVSEVAYFSL